MFGGGGGEKHNCVLFEIESKTKNKNKKMMEKYSMVCKNKPLTTM